MSGDGVLDKVRKLLRLSTSSNANEAALAAAKAQELIDRHQLQAALLALDTAQPTQGLDDEPIQDFQRAGAPLEAGTRRDRWRSALAMTIARHNACRIYLSGNDIALVGRPSDAETVRYLYGYLSRETERLTTEHGKGMGRVWRNNFRLGVVDAIAVKLTEQHRQFEAESRALARQESSMALMRVDRALARIEARGSDVAMWMRSHLKLRTSGMGGAYDKSAREQGRTAGKSIALGSRGRLGSGPKGLPS